MVVDFLSVSIMNFAAQILSISQRALDYLIATRRLPIRRIGGRVLIPVSELRKYARTDHPERIVA
jgi:excisionase family DNA binding protein